MSGEEDKLDRDGIRNDGVSYYDADSQRQNKYQAGEHQLSQSQSPILVSESKPHTRLYVAAFDGTGNDKNKDTQHKTNVGKISEQITDTNNPRIQSGYVVGPGTQSGGLARTRDGAICDRGRWLEAGEVHV